MMLKPLQTPYGEAEWRQAASALIRANLKLARMNHIDLSLALRQIGIDEAPKNISSKLARGSFSATFFLQALYVMGVNNFTLPLEGAPSSPASDIARGDGAGE